MQEIKAKFQKYDDALDEHQSSESWGTYGDFQLVGNGKQTNANCGRFLAFKGCNRVEEHDKTTLDGENYKGIVYVKKVHASCDKPTCPICYKSRVPQHYSLFSFFAFPMARAIFV